MRKIALRRVLPATPERRDSRRRLSLRHFGVATIFLGILAVLPWLVAPPAAGDSDAGFVSQASGEESDLVDPTTRRGWITAGVFALVGAFALFNAVASATEGSILDNVVNMVRGEIADKMFLTVELRLGDKCGTAHVVALSPHRAELLVQDQLPRHGRVTLLFPAEPAPQAADQDTARNALAVAAPKKRRRHHLRHRAHQQTLANLRSSRRRLPTDPLEVAGEIRRSKGERSGWTRALIVFHPAEQAAVDDDETSDALTSLVRRFEHHEPEPDYAGA
jgi:hypothetical protein